MFVILSQVVLALACLAWTTSAQTDSSDDFGGLYLYMEAKTAEKYYRGSDERHFYIKNGVVQSLYDRINVLVSESNLSFVWYGQEEKSIQAFIRAISADDEVLEVLIPSIPANSVPVPSSPESRSGAAHPSTDLYINLTCLAQGNVETNITFQFLARLSTLDVTVSFTKKCSGGVDTPTSGEEDVPSGVKQILYIVTGLVAGVVVVIIVIVVIYHWRVLTGMLRRHRTESDDDVDMSRDALHEAVFGMLEQYQEEPVPYAYHRQESPPYMHPNQEPGPPGYTSCDEVPNGMAFPYQIAATNNTGLVTPGNQTTPSQSTVNVPARSGHRPVSASWNSVPFDGRFTEMSRITIGELLRQGSFTQVRNGYLDNAEDDAEGATPVMIKTVKGDAPRSIVAQLVEGVSVLLHCNHRHCMPILGVHYTDTMPPMFLIPRAKYGTLKHTLLDLQENGLRSRFNRMLSPQDLVYFAMQIARGMYHLTKKTEQVHKDLAARNIFVHDNLQIKVGDSALSWDLFPDDYQMLSTGEMIATKWQPVEVLSEGNYTMYSDVWSFGVVLWELFTLGQSPYKEIPAEHQYAFLTSGQRLPQPSTCPDEVFTLMGQCWALTAQDRPRFSFLTIALEEFHTKLNCFI